MIPMSRFIDKLGIEEMIGRMVTVVQGSNAKYELGMIFKAITLGVISGCRHLSDIVRLGMDEALMKTQGWESLPVLSSITRVLERFDFRHCIELNEVQKKVRQKVWDKKRYGRVTMDFDSSAKSAYGHQEGVARGHNTERSHKPMLNPIFAFIAQTGECLNAWLRPGNTFSANGSVEFLEGMPCAASKICLENCCPRRLGLLQRRFRQNAGETWVRICDQSEDSKLEKAVRRTTLAKGPWTRGSLDVRIPLYR